MRFVVKFFPEIMVKGGAEKKRIINMLAENVRTLLFRIDSTIEVKRFFDKIEVMVASDKASQVQKILTQTPGIEQVLEVTQYETGSDLRLIAEKIAQHYLPLLENKSFVVRGKRAGIHDITSTEIERFVGEFLLKNAQTSCVDLKCPDVSVEFELVNDVLSVVTKRIPGLSGFPIGAQGEVLSLMSGGFDSTVASYLTMRRGMKTHFVFFNLGGSAHEVGVKQVALYLWSQFGASHRVQFIAVPFEEVVAELIKSTHESYMGIILKQLMIIAAEKLADAMGIDAIVTGESVAQVSSQTLRNLAVIDQVANKLVLRPLIAMGKPEIIALADKIGTRKFAEDMPEYCGVTSKNPVIKSSFSRAQKEMKAFDYSVLEAALEKSVSRPVDKIVEDVNNLAPVEVLSDLNEQIVIDIRTPAEIKRSALSLASIHIPFSQLKREFKLLDQTKEYVLYCDKGVMSQLHAQYLRDMGFENVKVYRP